jgi:hypothetical protein
MRATSPPILRAKREVRAQWVGVINFIARRGWAVPAWLVHRTSEPAFTVAIAYYADCDPRDLSGTPLGASRRGLKQLSSDRHQKIGWAGGASQSD